MTLLTDRLWSTPRFARTLVKIAHDLDPDLAEVIVSSRSAPVYEVTNVARYLAESGTEYDRLDCFPNVMPLHPCYWIEWTKPTALLSVGCTNPPDRVAVAVIAHPTPNSEAAVASCVAWASWGKRVKPQATWLVQFTPDGPPEILDSVATETFSGIHDDWSLPRDRSYPMTMSLPHAAELAEARERLDRYQTMPPGSDRDRLVQEAIDDLNALRDRALADVREADDEVRQLDEKLDGLMRQYLQAAVLFPAFMAHSLLACRNVDTDVHVPPEALSKKHRRKHGTPLVTYRTLRIRPMGVRQPTGTTPDTDHLDLALHIVRGHFKTYTADRPLLGRHVGTYWWSQGLRGAKEHGVVIKDYEVAV